MDVSVFNFFLAGLVPLFVAGLEDAKSRQVSSYLFVFIAMLGVAHAFIYQDVFALGLGGMLAVLFKLKPSILPKGDKQAFFSLALLYGVHLVPLLGLSMLFVLIYNLVKRRPFNAPVPTVTFLFVSAALINASMLVGLIK